MTHVLDSIGNYSSNKTEMSHGIVTVLKIPIPSFRLNIPVNKKSRALQKAVVLTLLCKLETLLGSSMFVYKEKGTEVTGGRAQQFFGNGPCP